ncbi:phosphomannomutase/phosphoglucomutase [Novosphingobium sp. FKTRR1]|uniref:phosphomannomutase/phosphoglucomutase n=1 Tax=Novosphingobium sp. FKTRR1 TaxID=2879118 RepID=UPI001CF00365|nr:phosphomannomutase/phosphoglucomutase [Novosphingobium sp. FKTRR1]
MPGHHFHPSLLREYDIRGVFGETLFVEDAWAIGRSFAAILARDKASAETPSPDGTPPDETASDEAPFWVAVGYDGRLSSPALEAALVEGLRAGGVNVVRIGLGPTPMLYFAEAELGSGAQEAGPFDSKARGSNSVQSEPAPSKTAASGTPDLAEAGSDARAAARPISAVTARHHVGPATAGLGATGPSVLDLAALKQVPAKKVIGGIQVTGSHNPGDHNGFKIVRAGRPFFGPDILDLGHVARTGDWGPADSGNVTEIAVIDAYVERLVQGLGDAERTALSGLRIAWDGGNGAAGPVIERLVRQLPGQHTLLFTVVDGHFPNHHPDPSEASNLDDLQRAVAQGRLDFGLAFDGDGDRLGVVDSKGRILWGDQILLIAAQDVLAKYPGAGVIADIKASKTLFDAVAQMGGVPEMWKTGHSHIKSRMKQSGALLGGEMTGHLFFADDYYGFDDALYGAVRMLAATARLGRSLTQLRDAMPEPFSTPELRFVVAEERKFAVIDEVLVQLQAEGADFVAIDGARVTTPDGWWLLRASNTQAMLTARAESDTPEGLERLLATIDARLAACGIVRTRT